MQSSFIVCQSIDKRRKIGAWFWPAFTSKQLQTKTFVCVLFGSEGRWAGANANKMLRQLFSYSRPYSFFLNRSPMASSPWVLGCMGFLSWDWDWSADFLSTICLTCFAHGLLKQWRTVWERCSLGILCTSEQTSNARMAGFCPVYSTNTHSTCTTIAGRTVYRYASPRVYFSTLSYSCEEKSCWGARDGYSEFKECRYA